jgi:hypothetical protein
MSEGETNMNIDDLKKEFKRIKAREDETKHSGLDPSAMDELSALISKQDREDRGYLLRKRLLPLFAGLLAIGFLLAKFPLRFGILSAGILLVFIALALILFFYYQDYQEITRESFDMSMMDFLRQKERRLKSWRKTQLKYNLTFVLFLIGVLLLILGNRHLIRTLSGYKIFLFLAVYFGIFLVSWFLGERSFRKRHLKKHRPLIEIIEQLKEEFKQ